jgi:hypothetical protein
MTTGKPWVDRPIIIKIVKHWNVSNQSRFVNVKKNINTKWDE